MPNRLIEKIRAYFKKIDIEDQSIDDDLIQYEPLPEKMIEESNQELDKALQFKINKWGF